jgi:hypothetical protein
VESGFDGEKGLSETVNLATADPKSVQENDESVWKS